ncbi:LuxR C-terminal-related transcriptional regulator [Nocardioides sp. Arc9.136]|uniref:LuxR C-terminal-related transcriptional regulator n=1 Tax=Nocardioides sp. Arc9.136 TaxID=2996826 RepID=UPI002664EABB|nr:LuxR C-terminal-related transcriptional regulator [Nocardioides sp. Arc9.136]WKN49000.1 LuxR C-terminal-related transcriptional regulator [Nocardioides sp. Arc9.136]
MDASGASRAWRSTLTDLRERSGAPMVFGGPVGTGGLRLTHFVGARTGSLDGLVVRAGSGLGGRVLRESDVLVVEDYGLASEITHDYDAAVSAEGLRTVVGAPVVVGRSVRGVVYAGLRGAPGRSDHVLRLRAAATGAARHLAREIAVEDEVERRVAARQAEEARSAVSLGRAHAELRELAASTTDPALGARLERIAAAMVEEAPAAPPLSPRQVDVLALVATGAPYAVVAERLGLSAQTVKSYMRDLLVVLGAHGRHEAVAEARRRGLLP